MRAMLGLLVIGAAAISAACKTGPSDCGTAPRPGITVVITDANTGALLIRGSTLIVSEGAFRDSVYAELTDQRSFTELGAAVERAGSYTVTVRRDGYQEWTQNGVRVGFDGCHVTTHLLLAGLIRKPI